MCVSVANETDVTPKPRIAVVGTRFVKTTYPSNCRFGIVYAPVWWKLCFVTPYGEKRAYAPESCSVSIFRPRIQPSFVTASAISMCHGPRVGDPDVPRRPRRRPEDLLLARPAPLHRPPRLEREQGGRRVPRRVDLP